MSRTNASVATIICFTCRQTNCGCVAALNHVRPDEVFDLRPRGARIAQALAWLGGACVAGTALGTAVALLLGG